MERLKISIESCIVAESVATYCLQTMGWMIPAWLWDSHQMRPRAETPERRESGLDHRCEIARWNRLVISLAGIEIGGTSALPGRMRKCTSCPLGEPRACH